MNPGLANHGLDFEDIDDASIPTQWVEKAIDAGHLVTDVDVERQCACGYEGQPALRIQFDEWPEATARHIALDLCPSCLAEMPVLVSPEVVGHPSLSPDTQRRLEGYAQKGILARPLPHMSMHCACGFEGQPLYVVMDSRREDGPDRNCFVCPNCGDY